MSQCRSCGAEIKWIRMKGTGKAMPVEGPDFDELTVHAWADLDPYEG